MSHQFKAGDLALIVGANTFIENIGAVCELVQFFEPGGRVKAPDGSSHLAPGYCWLVIGDGVVGAYDSRFLREVVRTPGYGLVAPEHLMPLRGDFAPSEQKSQAVPA